MKMKVTQIRSVINRPEKQKRTMEALGLRRMHSSRIHEDSPGLQGMLNVVRHLVRIEPVEG